MERAVAYYRVFTKQQHRSGLGIEAQRAAVTRFAEAEGFTIISEYVEAETGKGADALDRRPQLAAALAAARTGKCSVLVSKLDRLSRDVAFVAGLMAQPNSVTMKAVMPIPLCCISTPRRHAADANSALATSQVDSAFLSRINSCVDQNYLRPINERLM